ESSQQALADLLGALEDARGGARGAAQRLNAFLLRHGHVYAGKSRWTQAHFRWLEQVTMATPTQQIVLQEYIDTVTEAQRRMCSVMLATRRAWPEWSLAPVVEALMALRGISLVAAMTLLAELGDVSSFDSPTQLRGSPGR